MNQLSEVFGQDGDLYEIDYSGRTDPLLGRCLRALRVSERTESNQAFVDAYVRHLSAILADTPATLLPGECAAGSARPDCLVLTGNVRSGARWAERSKSGNVLPMVLLQMDVSTATSWRPGRWSWRSRAFGLEFALKGLRDRGYPTRCGMRPAGAGLHDRRCYR